MNKSMCCFMVKEDILDLLLFFEYFSCLEVDFGDESLGWEAFSGEDKEKLGVKEVVIEVY